MKTRLKLDKPIDPGLAKRILISLDHACLKAAREVGAQMGFTIDHTNFVLEPSPDPVTSIDFEFKVTLTKE